MTANVSYPFLVLSDFLIAALATARSLGGAAAGGAATPAVRPETRGLVPEPARALLRLVDAFATAVFAIADFDEFGLVLAGFDALAFALTALDGGFFAARTGLTALAEVFTSLVLPAALDLVERRAACDEAGASFFFVFLRADMANPLLKSSADARRWSDGHRGSTHLHPDCSA